MGNIISTITTILPFPTNQRQACGSERFPVASDMVLEIRLGLGFFGA